MNYFAQIFRENVRIETQRLRRHVAAVWRLWAGVAVDHVAARVRCQYAAVLHRTIRSVLRRSVVSVTVVCLILTTWLSKSVNRLLSTYTSTNVGADFPFRYWTNSQGYDPA